MTLYQSSSNYSGWLKIMTARVGVGGEWVGVASFSYINIGKTSKQKCCKGENTCFVVDFDLPVVIFLE